MNKKLPLALSHMHTFICDNWIVTAMLCALYFWHPLSGYSAAQHPRKGIKLELYFNPTCPASWAFFDSTVRPLEALFNDPRISFTLKPVRLDREGHDIKLLARMVCEEEARGGLEALKYMVPLNGISVEGASAQCKDLSRFYRSVVQSTAPGIRMFQTQYAPRFFVEGEEIEEIEGIRSHIRQALSNLSF